MHKNGHCGVALLVYAPVGFLTFAAGLDSVALLGGVIVVGGAMLPDLDMRVPFVKHRGPTHTVWFALAVGGVLGLAGVLVGSRVALPLAISLGVYGAFIGTLTVGAHLLADALTPMGVRPFEPISDRTYCFNLTRAASPISNYALLVLGIVAICAAFVLGRTARNAFGV